jgi:hypothetical protein
MSASYFDLKGRPVAYLDDDQTHFYSFDGTPLAYIQGKHLWNFDGKFLGWNKNGWLWDTSGNGMASSAHSVGGPVKPFDQFEPFKGFKRFLPFKGLQEYARFEPYYSFQWSNQRFW